jgi:hypothetical protein
MKAFKLRITLFATGLLAVTTFASFASDSNTVFPAQTISVEESEAALAAGIKALEEAKQLDEYEATLPKGKDALSGKKSSESIENTDRVLVNEPLISKAEKDKLTKKQRDNLAELERKGDNNFGVYKRQIKQVSGGQANAKRVRLSEVRNIVENLDFQVAVSEIEKIHGAPDFEGGSGHTIKEYWLDDAMKEKIIVSVESNEIFYIKMLDQVTSEHVEKLSKVKNKKS